MNLGHSETVEHFDMLAIYEREDEEARAKVCPVCHVEYDAPPQLAGRIIQFVGPGPDEWTTYACPACRPEEFRKDAEGEDDPERWIERMLERAARDRAAGRRLEEDE